MSPYPYTLSNDDRPLVGLIVLQADETIENDFRYLVPNTIRMHVSRVPSGLEVTAETLREMEGHLTGAASLFPRHLTFDAVGYACTSGAAHIGSERVAELVQEGTKAQAVTDPLAALAAACDVVGARRLAVLSPYVESVSDRLLAEAQARGIETPIFGTFAEPIEANVARIEDESVFAAALQMTGAVGVDALFLSCTNLRTLAVIRPLEEGLGIPVFSSNLVLAWHLLRLAGKEGHYRTPSTLLSERSSD